MLKKQEPKPTQTNVFLSPGVFPAKAATAEHCFYLSSDTQKCDSSSNTAQLRKLAAGLLKPGKQGFSLTSLERGAAERARIAPGWENNRQKANPRPYCSLPAPLE